jgi:hypothetical protein
LCLCIRPDGYLYDKEAILEYIVHQKREIARKLKEYEKQKQNQEVLAYVFVFFTYVFYMVVREPNYCSNCSFAMQ